MTPKEQAIFLFDKFIDYVNCWDDDGNADYYLAKSYAKECCIIYVNGMIDIISNNQLLINNLIYWEEVKKEIENI